jgi:hypothetical protein
MTAVCANALTETKGEMRFMLQAPGEKVKGEYTVRSLIIVSFL